jgi:hypothetical protein
VRAAYLIVLVIAIAGCGATAAATSPSARRASPRVVRRAAPVTVRYHPLFSLAAAVQDPAIARLGAGRFVLLGGIDAADTSTDGVIVANARGQLDTASLPNAQHDAQAATLAGAVYVFGGGQFSEYDHILGFDPAAGSVSVAGALPRPASDVAVAQTGAVAYVVGGFDGVNWLDTILAWRPGTQPRIVGHLPVALRYTAATAVQGKVLIIGGSTPTGASNVIYRFDPATGAVAPIGRLPQAVTHAGAAVLGSTVYLVGGRGDNVNARTARVWAINPSTGATRAAGRLPAPMSDAGVVSLGDAIIVAGGHTEAGTQAAVGELVPAG